MRNIETIKKYLPSKKFILIIFFIAILLASYFIISTIVKKNKAKKAFRQETIERLTGLTVSDLVEKDTDGDGVPDWEESLWGTDKNNRFTFNGIIDSEYVARKKKEINPNFNTIEEENITETDKFARQFFSSFLAMKEGGVDNLTINNFASSIGQNLVNTQIADEYTEKDIKITTNEDKEALANYYANLQKIFEKYSKAGFGEEVPILEKKIHEYSTTGFVKENQELENIAIAYQEFAKEIMKYETPKILSSYQLEIANNAYKTGTSVLGMTKVVNDPILGISGLTQYQKHSAEFVANVKLLEDFLQKNGIISI